MSTSFEYFYEKLRQGSTVQTDRAAQLIDLLIERILKTEKRYRSEGWKAMTGSGSIDREEVERILNIRIEVPDEDEEPSAD